MLIERKNHIRKEITGVKQRNTTCGKNTTNIKILNYSFDKIVIIHGQLKINNKNYNKKTFRSKKHISRLKKNRQLLKLQLVGFLIFDFDIEYINIYMYIFEYMLIDRTVRLFG